MGVEPASRRATDRLMLISIRPRHVDRILDGSKTIELRRTRPLVVPGQQMLIYATTPTAAIVARCRLRAVETSVPLEVWLRHHARLGVSRAEFDAYYSDAKSAVALHLEHVEPLLQPVTLGALRARRRFQPPQTWHFLAREAAELMLGQANRPAPAAPSRAVPA